MPDARNILTPEEKARIYAGEPPTVSPPVPVPAKRLLTINAALERNPDGTFVVYLSEIAPNRPVLGAAYQVPAQELGTAGFELERIVVERLQERLAEGRRGPAARQTVSVPLGWKPQE